MFDINATDRDPVRHVNLMMTPPAEFLAELKKISPDLEVVFETAVERWVIYYNNVYNGRRYRVHEVKEVDGSYRPLDQRTIDIMRMADMSTKIEDPAYIFSKQYREREYWKKKQIEKHRDDQRARARDMRSKWNAALDNAEKGIFSDHQLQQKKIYSWLHNFMKIPKATRQLVMKFGKPHLTGKPTLINPK